MALYQLVDQTMMRRQEEINHHDQLWTKNLTPGYPYIDYANGLGAYK